MLPRLQSLLITLTVALFLAVASVELRSVWVVDELTFARQQPFGGAWTVYDAQSAFGDVVVFRLVTPTAPHSTGLNWFSRHTSANDRLRQTFIGFGTRAVSGGRGVSFPLLALIMPPLLITAVVHLRVSRQLRARQRRAAGLCVGCGYDLRSSPERCPECGRGATA